MLPGWTSVESLCPEKSEEGNLFFLESTPLVIVVPNEIDSQMANNLLVKANFYVRLVISEFEFW